MTIVMFHYIGASDNPYDFGIFENDSMLKSLFKEDQTFQGKIEKISESSKSLREFLELQKVEQVHHSN